MKDITFDFCDALHSPLITFDVTWADCIPDRIKKLVTRERLAALLRHEELATLPEVVIYLTTRSFNAPMDSDWTDIFTHCSCRVLLDHFGEDNFDQLGARKALTNDQNRDLTALRRKIWESRRAALKKRQKEASHA
jgi:hypothetical protein